MTKKFEKLLRFQYPQKERLKPRGDDEWNNDWNIILTDYHDDVVCLDGRCCGTSNENERHYY